MKRPILFLLAICVLGLGAGCATKGGTGQVAGGGKVSYGDAKAVETVTQDWGSTDIQSTAEELTQSLLQSPYIVDAVAKPKIRLRTVKNQTYEKIDTAAITEKIRVKLLKSGTVRFLADTGNLDQVQAERDFTETATKKGALKQMTDTDYIVTGTVRSIKKSNSDMQDVYYSVMLELLDPQSAEIVWTDEKEIRKTKEKSTLGW